ncbi:hypothetical protein FPV67DRAFT_1481783 [Lyophyllum atratum]|nr:hypothetical protein FPV67DRAFT_1481783 [Lyophyllum atratum]
MGNPRSPRRSVIALVTRLDLLPSLSTCLCRPLRRVACSGHQSAGPAMSSKSRQVGYVLSVPHATCLLHCRTFMIIGIDIGRRCESCSHPR